MDYDVGEAFRKIENELIASMIRNMERHKVEEITEGKQWGMWQAEQLRSLELYRRENQKKFSVEFADINAKIEEMIRYNKNAGMMEQENAILRAIKNGYKPKTAKGISGQFFQLNERKLEALIAETKKNMQNAETAILRMSNDRYRKVIFNAQVYANTGAGTYEQAVDMATKDYLSSGINCIEYKNGARVNVAAYAEMALRTANTRAYLQGEGQKRQEWGITTVIMNKRGTACHKCFRFAGKVFIDDVWSGGTSKDGPYPLLSSAIAQGLYHPNCKDIHTTYFPGISEPPNELTEQEKTKSRQEYEREQKKRYAQHEADRFERMARYSLDEENKRKYMYKRDTYDKTEVHSVEKANNIATEAIVEQYIHRVDDLGVNYVPYSEFDDVMKKNIGADFSGMDERLAESTAKQFKKLSDEYESMCQKIEVKKFDSMIGSAPASTELSMNVQQGILSFNKSIMNDREKFMRRMAKAVGKNQFPMMEEEVYEKYVVTHEFAHTIMDFESPLKNYVSAETSHISKARKEIQEIREEYQEKIRLLTVQKNEAEMKALTSFDEEDWKVAQQLDDELKKVTISEYADMSIDEFMAEAFADAKIGSNPSEYSKKVEKVIDKHFKKEVVDKEVIENTGKNVIIKLSNKEVREKYINEVSKIKDNIDKSLPMEEQAKQAFEARNNARTKARNSMADTKLREQLDEEHPNKTFEELVKDKMDRKGLTREEAIQDVYDTATKTNKDINKEL